MITLYRGITEHGLAAYVTRAVFNHKHRKHRKHRKRGPQRGYAGAFAGFASRLM